MILRKINNYFGITRLHSYFKYIIMDAIAGSHIIPNWLRKYIYNLCGHNIEGTVYPECFLGYGPKGKLAVGRGTYCNYRCFFDLGDDITIGKNCSIAFGVTFCNSYHEVGSKLKRAGG